MINLMLSLSGVILDNIADPVFQGHTSLFIFGSVIIN